MTSDEPGFRHLLAAAMLSFCRELNWADRNAFIYRLDVGIRDESGELPRKIGQAARTGFPILGADWPTARVLRASLDLARFWEKQGIAYLPSDRNPTQHSKRSPPTQGLWVMGDLSLLTASSAAFLNSRTPRLLHPETPWLEKIRAFGLTARTNHWVTISSLGTASYELACLLALRQGLGLVVVMDHPLWPMRSAQKRPDSFLELPSRFDRSQILWCSPFPPGVLPPPKTRKIIRDRWVAHLASFLVIGETRPRGIMAGLAAEAKERGRPVIHLKTGSPEHRPPKPDIRTETRFQTLPDADFDPEDYVFHYTRSCPGPWPGQSPWDYYRALLDREPDSDHSAFGALIRILEEGRIRASGRMIRGGIPVVSLTSVPPHRIQKLIQWRKALVRWTMEPYGLALNRKWMLTREGGRPVVYGSEDQWNRLPEKERFRFQVRRSGAQTWAREMEWRVPGDLRLEEVPKNLWLALVREVWEARVIETRFGIKAISLSPGSGDDAGNEEH